MNRPADDTERRVRVSIHGKVQGVGFRYFVRQYARQENVGGWVRNRSDGSVELEACGSQKDISRLIAKVEQGPTTSRVQSVEVTDLRDGRAWDEFEIVPTTW